MGIRQRAQAMAAQPPLCRRYGTAGERVAAAVIGTQLSLSVQLTDAASFDNFYAGPNAATAAVLRQLAEEGGKSSVLLHGAIGSGKTSTPTASSDAGAYRCRPPK